MTSVKEIKSEKVLIEVEKKECPVRQIFSALDCKVQKVVVYKDRAEVCRLLEVKLNKGDHEIVVNNLSKCIDEDSIRVEGRGSGTIQEVAYRTEYVGHEDEEENRKTKRQQITENIDTLMNQKDILEMETARYKKQWDLLNGFGKSITQAEPQLKEDSDRLQLVSRFMDMFDSKSATLDEKLVSVKRQLENIDKEIDVLNKNLLEFGTGASSDVKRECSILLECNEDSDTPMALVLSYVVNNASWSSKYDIRVFPEEKKLKLMYFALIKQATDEDWLDTRLHLSTAQPSIGGVVPLLGTANLSRVQEPHVKRTKSLRAFGVGFSKSQKSNRTMSVADEGMVITTDQHYILEDEQLELAHHILDLNVGHTVLLENILHLQWTFAILAMPRPSVSKLHPHLTRVQIDRSLTSLTINFQKTIQATDNMMSLSYEVPRLSSVPCDNVEHKVAVGIIDLEASFEYETVPQLAPHTFLKAKVINKSEFALLPGTANIFLNNNFVAKSALQSVSPGEEFSVSLGADPAVKVDYKPLMKMQERSGLLTKVVTMTYTQMTSIKNAHKTTANIIMKDSVPRSTDEKIKVVILEPPLSAKQTEREDKSGRVLLNKAHNIEWHFDLEAGQSREITLKYSVEYPAGEEIITNITFSQS